MNKYEDIIDKDRPLSRYPKMSMKERTYQFASFSALTGFSDLTDDAGINLVKRKKLSSDAIEHINKLIIEGLNKKSELKITYFTSIKNNLGKYDTKKIKIYKVLKDKIITSEGEIFKKDIYYLDK